MPDLSPAAQAVLTAASVAKDHAQCPIAAALRAAADQVVPEEACETPDWVTAVPGDFVCAETQHRVRSCLLAFAAELDAT